MLNQLKQDLNKLARPNHASVLGRFFKTGPGEYGEGDKFLGIPVPQQRAVAKKYLDLLLNDLQKLLNSKIHEHRLVGLLILVNKFEQASKVSRDPSASLRSARDKLQIFNFYLKNTTNINNWDLVDLSAYKILGNYLLDKDRQILYKLSRSKNLWERRIAVISTFVFINNNDFKDSIKIATILLKDKHDLIHKAVGWMLREIGKRDQKTLIQFLDKHSHHMPRTMLRYAIEKFSEPKRKYYLKKHPLLYV